MFLINILTYRIGYRYRLLSAIKYRLIGKSADSIIGASLLLTLHEKFPKIVVFCCTLLQCDKIYGRLKRQLGKSNTESVAEPPGSVAKYC